MKRFLRIALITVLVAGAGAGAVSILRARKVTGKLRTAVVKRGDLTVKVSDTGTVEPRLKVEVKSKVAGRIIAVLVDEGDRVKKGQTVARIDRTELERNLRQTLADLDGGRARLAQAILRAAAARKEYETSVTQSEARLDEAEANLKGIQAGPRSQEIAQAEANVLSMQISLKDAETAYKQQLALFRQGVLRRRQAEADVKAAEAALAELKAGARTQEVHSAEAGVERAEATLTDARRGLTRQQQLFKKGFVAEQVVQSAETRVALAEADLKRAREQLALVKAGSRREEIDSARARLDRVKAVLAGVKTTNEKELAGLKARVELARADLNRAEEALALLKAGPRPEEVAAAQARVRQARAALAAARNGVSDVQVADQEVVQAQAAVTRLEQLRDNVQTQLEDTIITSPITGTVIDRAIDPGELVTSGVAAFSQGQTILTVADLSEMRVEARVNEVDVAKLRVGQAVDIRVDALRGKTLKGLVNRISPAAVRGNAPQNSGIVMFDVRIVIPRPDSALKTGMSADVDVIVDRAKKVLYLPLEAVWKKGKKWYARRVLNPEVVKQWEKQGRKGKLPEIKTQDVVVECGRRNSIAVEIKKGLKEGDMVRIDNIHLTEKRRKFDIKP